MAIPQIEFGLSEIGAFEFALEQGALTAATKFIFEGGSEALFGGVVKSNSAFLMNSSSSAAYFKGQSIKLADVAAIKGTALVVLIGASLRSASASFSAESDAFFESGLINQGSLISSGKSLFEVVYIEPETLDIKGSSKVSWASGFKKGTQYSIQGKSEFNLVRAAVAHALLSIGSSGEGSTKLFAQAINKTTLEAAGSTTVAIRANGSARSSLVSTSLGLFKPNITSIANTVTHSKGKASGVVRGYAVSYGSFGMQGVAVVEAKTSVINQSSFTADGLSFSNIRPGSPVLLVMPEAWDVVIRPYENREATWK